MNESTLYKSDYTYIENMINLTKSVIQSQSRDDFLEIYNNDNKHVKFHNVNTAKNKLFSFKNGLYGKIISEIKNQQLDCMIAGSSSLSSIIDFTRCSYLKKFLPNDIDIYMKNATEDNIIKLDNLIRELFPKNIIIIVRRPITVTWYVFNNNITLPANKKVDDDNELEIQIQLNVLKYSSWSEVFIDYHSDIVCVGYEVLSDEFIFMKERFCNFMKNFPSNYIITLVVSYIDIIYLFGFNNTIKKLL